MKYIRHRWALHAPSYLAELEKVDLNVDESLIDLVTGGEGGQREAGFDEWVLYAHVGVSHWTPLLSIIDMC